MHKGQKITWDLKRGGTVTATILKMNEDAILDALVNPRAVRAGRATGGAKVTRLGGGIVLHVETVDD